MNVERRMPQWLRFCAWLSVLGLALASWTPGEDMIRTGVRGSFEHIVTYLISPMLLVSAFPRTSPWMIDGALASYAGILEIGIGLCSRATQPIGRLCWELLGGCDHCRAHRFVDVLVHAQVKYPCGAEQTCTKEGSIVAGIARLVIFCALIACDRGSRRQDQGWHHGTIVCAAAGRMALRCPRVLTPCDRPGSLS
jgi:hypothetical protein